MIYQTNVHQRFPDFNHTQNVLVEKCFKIRYTGAKKGKNIVWTHSPRNKTDYNKDTSYILTPQPTRRCITIIDG